MTKPIKWENSLTILFMIISVIIIVLMLVQYIYGSKYRDELLQQLGQTQSAGFAMDDIPGYHPGNKGMDLYFDIVQRPLFFKVRRPIEPKEDEEEEIVNTFSEKFDFILTGIINTPTTMYCLLQNPRARDPLEKFRRLEQGEEIEGRTIKEIKADRVVIAYNGKIKEIMLSKPRSRKALPKKVKKPKKAKKIQPRKKPQKTKAEKLRRNPFNQKFKK
jgi:hypothetical protein